MASFVETLKVCSAGTITVVDMAWCNPGGRGWCLYEWNHTYTLHGIEALQFVGMSEDDRQRIINEIDVEKAKCAKVDDQTMILGEILQNHGSYKAFNHKLKLLLQLKPLSYSVDLHQLWMRCKATVWNFRAVRNWLGAPLLLVASSDSRVEAGATEGRLQTCTAFSSMSDEKEDTYRSDEDEGEDEDENRSENDRRANCSGGPSLKRHCTNRELLAWDFTNGDMALRGYLALPGARVLCVIGGAGTGKSTFSATVIRDVLRASLVVTAVHFCKQTDQRRQEPIGIVQSLVF